MLAKTTKTLLHSSPKAERLDRWTTTAAIDLRTKSEVLHPCCVSHAADCPSYELNASRNRGVYDRAFATLIVLSVAVQRKYFHKWNRTLCLTSYACQNSAEYGPATQLSWKPDASNPRSWSPRRYIPSVVGSKLGLHRHSFGVTRPGSLQIVLASCIKTQMPTQDDDVQPAVTPRAQASMSPHKWLTACSMKNYRIIVRATLVTAFETFRLGTSGQYSNYLYVMLSPLFNECHIDESMAR